MANRTCTKKLQSSKILRPGLSEIFFCSLHVQWRFKFPKKVLIWLKKISSIKKTTKKQSWKISEVKFWPKPNMQNCLNKSIKFGTLTQLTCFMFLIKMVKMLWSYKKYIKKKRNLKEIGPNYDQKFACSYNPGQKIRNRIEIQENWTGQEKFGIYFWVFLTPIAKV